MISVTKLFAIKKHRQTFWRSKWLIRFFFIFIINDILILYIIILQEFYNSLMFEFSKDVWANATVLTTTSLTSLPNLDILTESFLANKIEKSEI